MDCPQVFRRLSPSLDDELPAEEAAAVRRHVESCTDCARQRDLLAAARGAFRSLSPEGRAPDFDAAVLRRLQRVPRPMWWLSTAAGFALLGLVLAREPAPTAPTGLAVVFDPAAGLTAGRDDGHETPGLDCGVAGAAACQLDMPCGERECAPVDAAIVDGPRLIFAASH